MEMGAIISHSHHKTRFEHQVEALVEALKQCTGLERGRVLHKRATETSFHTNKYVATALISMYGRCSSMLDARLVFDTTTVIHHNVVSWTSLILGYVENGESVVALDLFLSMDCRPNAVTFTTALKACSGLVHVMKRQFCLEKGMALHKLAAKQRLDVEKMVASSLVDMYRRFGSMSHARAVFDAMTPAARDIVSWTNLMLGYVDNGQSLVAMELFVSMGREPDSVTFVAALKACCEIVEERRFCLYKGMFIHKQARQHGFGEDVMVATSLLNMYGKCGGIVQARAVFKNMNLRNVVAWNSLILGYVDNGESIKAIELFTSMDCQPDSFTFVAALRACGEVGAVAVGRVIHEQIRRLGLEQVQVVANSLVDFYGKCGQMHAAEDVFGRMDSRTVVSWTALIAGYSSLGDTARVFCLVERMQEEDGLQPNDVTFLAILSACSRTGLVEEGKRFFESMYLVYGITPTPEHCACIVDMFERANRLHQAVELPKTPKYSKRITSIS